MLHRLVAGAQRMPLDIMLVTSIMTVVYVLLLLYGKEPQREMEAGEAWPQGRERACTTTCMATMNGEED